MQKIVSFFLLFLVTLSVLANSAQAARFGGGRSFGMHRSISSSPSRLLQPAKSLAQNAGGNKWLGPLAGLAAGGLLASLFMGHGIGSGLLSWLGILGVGLLLWNMLRPKLQSAPASTQSNFTPDANFASADNVVQYPTGFDKEKFLRDAKVQFIRMQAAYDTKNLNDLHLFTTPEVFGEIQLQLQERGDAVNYTEVVSVTAELQEAVTELNDIIASVKFSGMIREAVDAPAIAFTEVWHFRKENTKENWMVAGVQQQQ